MFFDLQFSESKFLELLTDQVQRALPLVTDEFDDPLIGQKVLIDHLDVSSVEIDDRPAKKVMIASPSGPVQINGTLLRLKINITAFLVTRAKVIAAGHLGVPSFDTFGLWVKV